jgi:hypothetical protein
MIIAAHIKRMLSVAVTAAGIVLLFACENGAPAPEPEPAPEPPVAEGKSLAGTTWKSRFEEGEEWMEEKLVFTATHATYTETNSAGNDMNFTGTYTYDQPTVVITSNCWNFPPPTGTQEAPGYIHHEGTVDGQTMTIGIQVYGMVGIIELKKQ